MHEKLGKPIPEVLSAEAQDKDKKKDGIVKTARPSFRGNPRRNRKPSAPKITFIGGNTLNTSGGDAVEPAAIEASGSEVAMPEDGENKAETTGSDEGKEIKLVG